jgi:hypothetical protein
MDIIVEKIKELKEKMYIEGRADIYSALEEITNLMEEKEEKDVYILLETTADFAVVVGVFASNEDAEEKMYSLEKEEDPDYAFFTIVKKEVI